MYIQIDNAKMWHLSVAYRYYRCHGVPPRLAPQRLWRCGVCGTRRDGAGTEGTGAAAAEEELFKAIPGKMVISWRFMVDLMGWK